MLFLASMAVGAKAILSLSNIALAAPEYSHLALVVPITAAVIGCERKLIFAAPNPRLKTALVALCLWSTAAAMLAAFSSALKADERCTGSTLLLVAFWIAAFCTCFGTVPTRKALFPLLLLVLVIPIPRPVAEGAIVFLQQSSADAVNFLYGLAGVPVLRHGQVFVFSNMQLEIARECSGIRSTVALFVVGLLLQHLFLRSKWSSAVLVLAILPLAIIKNGVRIFTLSMLAIYVDRSVMQSPLHQSGGVLFFVLALFFLALVLLLLMRVEERYCSTHGQTTVALLSKKEFV